MLEYKNVYQFCESPKNVTSGIIHFNLLQDTGLNHDISKTKETIEVNISRLHHTTVDDFQVIYDVNPLNGTTWFHRINWTSTDTAVNIELLPNSTCLVKWKLYVVYDEMVLSTQWPLLTFFSTNGTDTVHALQLSRDYYKNPGIYKIYLTVELSDELNELWKSHRNNISYRLGIYQSKCLHWNDEDNIFSSSGCKVRKTLMDVYI